MFTEVCDGARGIGIGYLLFLDGYWAQYGEPKEHLEAKYPMYPQRGVFRVVSLGTYASSTHIYQSLSYLQPVFSVL